MNDSTTVACLTCGTTITVRATDRQGIIELLGDYGWQATPQGGYCLTHKFRPSAEA